MSRPAHLTIDAGGTLLRPNPSVGTIYAEVLREHGGNADPAELELRFTKSFRKYAGDGRMDRPFWRKVVRSTLGEACPESRFEACFQDMWDTFAEGRRWVLVPGAEALLREFRRQGLAMSVLSNNDARLHNILADMGIREWFAEVFISEEIGAAKPSIEIFRHVERSLGCKPGGLLHIGDSLESDYLGATRAGWQARLLMKTRPAQVPEAHWWADWQCAPAVCCDPLRSSVRNVG